MFLEILNILLDNNSNANKYDRNFIETLNNLNVLLNFTDYINLALLNKELYNFMIQKRYLCFNLTDYKFYLSLQTFGTAFLFHNIENYDYVRYYLMLFGYIHDYRKIKIRMANSSLFGYVSGVGEFTPLHLAAMTNNLLVVKEICKYTSVNCVDSAGFTPLCLSVRRNYYDCSKFLLENSADMNHSSNYYYHGWSPLHAACSSGFADMVDLLLKFDVNANSLTVFDEPPMFLAFDHPKIVEKLVKLTDLSIINKLGMNVFGILNEKFLNSSNTMIIHESNRIICEELSRNYTIENNVIMRRSSV